MSKSLAAILGTAGVIFLGKGVAELKWSNFINSAYTSLMELIFKKQAEPIADLTSAILSLIIGGLLVFGAIYVATHSTKS